MAILSKLLTRSFVLFLFLLAFLWRGRLPDYSDAVLYAYPDRWVALDSFRQGFLPLWNPFIGCGTPHLANWVSSCLYPPFWVLHFTGLTAGFMPVILLHAGLSFLGFYLWMRAQKREPYACALGALVFACSGHLVRCWTNLSFITTAAWIPWIFWAAQRALDKPSYPRWFVLGAVLSLQVLAGYPFFTFYTVLFLVFWFEFQRPSLTVRLSFGATLAASALFTAIQWLPFLDFLSWSFHDAWTDYPYFTKPLEYLTLLGPTLLGTPGSSDYIGSFSNANFNLYIGILPLLFLLFSFFQFSKTKNEFWVLAAFFWLFWMAGTHFPLWKVLPRAWLEFVEPSKAAGLFVFCAATACATALHSFLREKWKPTLGWAWILAVLWTLDLLSVPFRLVHPLPDPFRDPTLQTQAGEAVQLTEGGRLLSLHRAGDLGGVPLGAESFKTPARMFLANSNAVWGIPSVDKYLFLQTDGSQNLARYFNKGFPYEGDLLDIAGAKLFLIPQVLSPSKFRVVGKSGGDLLIRNSRSSERARFVVQKTGLPDRTSVLNLLTRPGSGWMEKVHLENDPEGGWVGLEPSQRTLPPMIKVRNGYWRESAGHVFFAGGFDSPGYAAFNETYAPGWKAWVDGQPQPLLRAYGLFMAVPVNGGSRWVDLRYEPASFRLGLFLALIVLICAATALSKRLTSG